MSTNFGSYDIGVFFAADYLCGGSFYDSFEYFHMFKEKGYKTCLILMINEDEDTTWKAINDKYAVDLESLKQDIYFFNREDYRMGLKKIINIRLKVLFSPSMSAIAQMIMYGTLIPYEKIIGSQELPYEHEFIQAAFTGQRYVYKMLMLRDDRYFDIFPRYENRTYRQTIHFDIFKPLVWTPTFPVDDYCLINMCTDHKCYPVDELVKIMDEEFPERYLIYTKDKWYDTYKGLESDKVKVVLSPVDNFMNRFDKVLYLPSLRGADPSPRLLPECMYFSKKVIFRDWGKVKDGGYWRWHDCLHDFDSLIYEENRRQGICWCLL
jgi:hypothetical protein